MCVCEREKERKREKKREREKERERETVFINLHIVCVFIKLHMPHIPAMPFKLLYATHRDPPKGGSMIFTMKTSDETR